MLMDIPTRSHVKRFQALIMLILSESLKVNSVYYCKPMAASVAVQVLLNM